MKKTDIGGNSDAFDSWREKLGVYRRILAEKAVDLCVRRTDTRQWLSKFREKWLQKNKLSELEKIEEMFLYREEN